MTDERHWEKMYYMVREEFNKLQEQYTNAKVIANDLNDDCNKLRKRMGDIDAAVMRLPICGVYDTFTDVPDLIDQMGWYIKELTRDKKPTNSSCNLEEWKDEPGKWQCETCDAKWWEDKKNA